MCRCCRYQLPLVSTYIFMHFLCFFSYFYSDIPPHVLQLLSPHTAKTQKISSHIVSVPFLIKGICRVNGGSSTDITMSSSPLRQTNSVPHRDSEALVNVQLKLNETPFKLSFLSVLQENSDRHWFLILC